MAKAEGYLTVGRTDPSYRPVAQRIGDFSQVKLALGDSETVLQASRCLDCGVPFCHMYGCPLGNRVPDYSEAVANGRWKEALDILHATNNFPEITGRICPALCEASCTLAVNFAANNCQQIELKIAERGWQDGWIMPHRVPHRSGRRVAVVGSGPAGLAASQQLARAGHEVVVFEKSDRIGGLLMYGIPNFKLEKEVVDRRVDQLRAEGVVFETNVEIEKDISAQYLLQKFDAVILAPGTPKARDLAIPGRSLAGIHPALEYLSQQTKLVLGDSIPSDQLIDPKGKDVVVIGGGDTGSDCVGSVIRRGCRTVTQIELMPKPPQIRGEGNPWPQWPLILRTSSSHEEGCRRLWGIGSEQFIGSAGKVESLRCCELAWSEGKHEELPGSQFELPAQLVLLSMGFVPFEDSPLVKGFALSLDARGNIFVDASCRTSREKVFAAGDSTSGPSLVVRAIAQGRLCAESVHDFLASR